MDICARPVGNFKLTITFKPKMLLGKIGLTYTNDPSERGQVTFVNSFIFELNGIATEMSYLMFWSPQVSKSTRFKVILHVFISVPHNSVL